jgi:hypothetical protein
MNQTSQKKQLKKSLFREDNPGEVVEVGTTLNIISDAVD